MDKHMKQRVARLADMVKDCTCINVAKVWTRISVDEYGSSRYSGVIYIRTKDFRKFLKENGRDTVSIKRRP